MKKLFSLSVAALFALSAQAQNSGHPYRMDKDNNQAKANDIPKPILVSLNGVAKTTAVPFYTESFGSGTTTSLPAGWTASGNVPQGWKWNNVAETSQFTGFLGTINSTTKANGWLVFNADTIGSLNPSVPIIEGRVTSPAFSCVGHPTVLVSFQELFRRFTDSCFLEVSGDNGATYTSFPVVVNNSAGVNTTLPNPTTVSINVSSVAANQSQVRIRFYYKSTRSPSGDVGYLWSVDDVAVSELDPIDVEISDAAFLMTRGNPAGNLYTTFDVYPRQLVDTVFPIVRVTNRGSTAPANATVTANVRNSAAASVYSRSIMFTNVPVNAMDSIADFTLQTGFIPSTLGTYTGAFGLALTGDATPANNLDTATFAISDSLMGRNNGFITSNYFVHRPSSHPNGEASNFIGTIFDIAANKRDTVTGASVIFGSGTTVGTNATVQIYKFENQQWNFVTLSQKITLNASNISTTGAGGARFAYFPMNIPANIISNYILDGGTTGARYAAVVQGDGNPATSTVLVSTSGSIGESYVNISGVLDESNNDAGTDFGLSGLPSGLSGVTPWVRLHFSNYKPSNIGVNSIDGLVGSATAYPNPSSNQLFVPVTLSKAAELSVTLSTPMGQVVDRQDFGKVAAGQSVKAEFNTAGLANGIYFYTLEVAGERLTNRVVVSH